MSAVAIIDYGLGNLFSVRRALETVGASVRLISKPEGLNDAERVILPGVGAFADGMRMLESAGLAVAIREYAASGRPFMGICLGMQLMFSKGFEFGEHAGIGLFDGAVKEIPSNTTSQEPLRVPHVGWNHLVETRSWKGTPLANTRPGASVYFVHSFSAHPADRSTVLAETVYGGHPIVAVIQKEKQIGCQFHPERSGPVGLEILKTFLSL